MIRPILIGVAAVAILAAAAIAHGMRTDRWGATADLQVAADRLQTLPKQIGDWECEEMSLDPRQAEMTQASGILLRRYTHRYSRAGVSVMILCGRPGPISVHPPEACYGGAGFTPATPKKKELPGGGSLWLGDFVKEGPQVEKLRLHWGWSSGGEWTASESPRTEFMRSKVLYKMYIIYPVSSTSDSSPASAADPDSGLLEVLLPELRKCLVTAP